MGAYLKANRRNLIYIFKYINPCPSDFRIWQCSLGPHYILDQRSVEKVQRRATKLIHGLYNMDYSDRLVPSIYHLCNFTESGGYAHRMLVLYITSGGKCRI